MYLLFLNKLRFCLQCHHNKILLKDIQVKSRIKTERSKTMICDRLKNSIRQLKGKFLESITLEEFHLVEKIHQHLHKKSFDLTKKRHMRKFDELTSRNKVTQSTTNKTEKKKWVINMSSRQLTHIETNFFSQRALTSQLLLKHCLIKIS